jgi:hypothetical protein
MAEKYKLKIEQRIYVDKLKSEGWDYGNPYFTFDAAIYIALAK